MLELFYNFSLPFLDFLLRLFSFFIPRLKIFLQEREGLLERWQLALAKIPKKNRIWFHVSSVGELEQIRPVMEQLQQKFSYQFIVSFYSPSVPRLVKDWSFVAYADYLPLDHWREMKLLTGWIFPKMLVLNRYDLWPNLLRAARENKIPITLVNASTPPLGFGGWLSLWFRRSLFKKIYFWTFVDSVAAAAWEPYLRKDVQAFVAGNPRVDRALKRVDEAMKLGRTKKTLELWKHDKKLCIVAGSTWEKEEELLLCALQNLRMQKEMDAVQLVIVPHEPYIEHVAHTKKLCEKYGFSVVLFSELTQAEKQSHTDVLLVDARGVLAEIYNEAAVAFVGGGFGRETHSIIEPLAHGVPAAIGPKHHRSPEAKTLSIMGGAFVVNSLSSTKELAKWWQEILSNSEKAGRAKEAMKLYLSIHRGAGERVSDFLAERIKID